MPPKKNPTTNTYSKFDENIFQEHPYVVKTIQKDANFAERCICLHCSKNKRSEVSLIFKFLIRHLLTQKHQDRIPTSEKEQHAAMLLVLQNKLPKEDEEEKICNEIGPETILNSERNTTLDLNFLICQFIISSNLGFEAAPRLLNLIQTAFNRFHPDTIKNTHISKTTAKIIIKDCISATMRQHLLEICKSNYFSLLLDESSDLYGRKYLAVLIRYIDTSKRSVKTQILNILEVGTKSTGEELTRIIKENIFTDQKISKHCLALCTDSGSNMVSSKKEGGKGIFNRMKEDIPHLLHFKDIPHTLNLTIADILKKFPAKYRDFVQEISHYFAKSPQRKASFRELQLFLGVQVLQVLRFVPTRWTSLAK